MKKFKITETKQQVAVDILTELKVWMMGLPGNSEPTKSEQDVTGKRCLVTLVISKK